MQDILTGVTGPKGKVEAYIKNIIFLNVVVGRRRDWVSDDELSDFLFGKSSSINLPPTSIREVNGFFQNCKNVVIKWHHSSQTKGDSYDAATLSYL